MPKVFPNPQIKATMFQNMITCSKNMFSFFELVKKVSRTDAAVLIRGETGTGKDLAARAIHNLSSRHMKPFYAVNCATLTPELMASELFGHKKGAFTGAISDHKGYFEVAHKGSLFLDEIAELPLAVQSRLLRVLQDRTFTPLGSTQTNRVDVRLISATHRALRREVQQGRFREDLMYRVRVVPIFLPRLTQRERDIELLAWRFIDELNDAALRKITGIDQKARDALLAYTWPGNIRELRNNIEYAFAIGEGDVLTLDELTPELRGELPPVAESQGAEESDWRQEERRRLIEALNEAKGKKGEAAILLGLSRATLWRKMRDLGLS